MISQRLGIVFNFNKKGYPFFTIDLIEGEMDEDSNFAGNIQKLELAKYVNTDAYREEDKNLVSVVRKLQDAEIDKYVSRNSPFSGIWENIIHNEDDELPDETKKLIVEYLFPKLKKLFPEVDGSPIYILPKGKAFKTANLQRVEASRLPLMPQLRMVSKKCWPFVYKR